MKHSRSALSLVVLLLPLAPAALAKPAYRAALADYYGPFLPARLNNCGTCHVRAAPLAPPVSLADFPHNPFGDRLRRIGVALRAAGKRSDIPSRLRAVAAEDADRDGVPNQDEILLGRRPGDPNDRPARAELASLASRRARLRAFLAAYRWRPYEPVRRPPAPRVRNARWVRNPIDAFIAAEYTKRHLTPRPEAPKLVLLRRVYLDLIGLSPTPAEQRAFLADRSPHAYEKVVNRLLASPQYGERWARHWMDVWRYSDWAGWGEQVRDSKPFIWRWRDWIVDALNEDKGYDRMVVEMLAADEACPTDTNALRATGFLVRNFKLLSREKWMQDTVDYTGQAFLGLTVGCARCHDHMYDPISQKEYYRLRAVFEPHDVRTDWVPGQIDTNKDGLVRAYDARPEAATYLFVRGDERFPAKDAPLPPGVPEALGGQYQPQPVALPLLARAPEKAPYVIAALRADGERRVDEARHLLETSRTPSDTETAKLKLDAAETGRAALEAVLAVERLEDQGQKESTAWQEAATRAASCQRTETAAAVRLARSEAQAAVATLEAAGKPADLKAARERLAAAEGALGTAEAALKQPPTIAYKPRVATSYPATSTGRRLAFARWLTSPDNPLTARVAVNQIWMRHFGQGLVPTVENFGRQGQPPTHPELLDWLAAMFMATTDHRRTTTGGTSRNAPSSAVRGRASPDARPALAWRMKALHRLIVTSSTYRMASTFDAADAKRDPDNRFLWRMNSRRMDAEIVRDNVLHVAGALDLTRGGPDIDQDLGMKVPRRSLYFRHAAEKEMEFLATFDQASVTECYRRKETVAPQQALALANSDLAVTQARRLARELSAPNLPVSDTGFVNAAFERVLCRPPSRAEMAECVKFLADQSRRLPVAQASSLGPGPQPVSERDSASATLEKPAADPALRAREDLALVLLNHNDFVTIR